MSKNKSRLFLLLFILLLAASLRLYRINEYMTFLGDEGRDMLVVKRMIVDHKFTLLGPITSVGSIYMGPVYYYFMIPFLWAWNFNPVGPSIMVALFAVFTVFLVYRIGSEFFHPAAGFIASFFYATSPLTVLYGRSSWNPNVVPFFASLFMFGLFKTIVKAEHRFLIVSGAALGILIQLHYVTFLFFPILFFSLLLIRFRIPISAAAAGIGAFLLAYSPFLLFEMRHGFVNMNGAINFISQSRSSTDFGFSNFFFVIYDATVRIFWRLVVVADAEFTKVFILSVIILLVSYWKNKTHDTKKKQALLVLVIWFVAGVVSFGIYQGITYDYYFGSLFPTPFLFSGIAIWTLWQKKAAGQLLALGIMIVFFSFHVIKSPLTIDPNNLLRNTREISRFVGEKTEGKPYNFALIAGRNSDHAYRYFLEIDGIPPVPIETPAVDPERKTVMDQLLIVCEEKECKPLGHPLWEIAGFGPAEITDEWTVSTARLFRLVHYKE